MNAFEYCIPTGKIATLKNPIPVTRDHNIVCALADQFENRMHTVQSHTCYTMRLVGENLLPQMTVLAESYNAGGSLHHQ
jgi:hypothetical protein